MNGYEVLMTEKINLVLPEGLSKQTVPLELAINNSDKPFMTYGLPKDIKKFLKKKANVLSEIKTNYAKIQALVQSPVVGNIIDVGYSKEKPNTWIKEGIYVMSLEEAKEYSKIFNVSFCTIDSTIKMILNSLDIVSN